jgi:hypothetical protein
MSDEDRALVPTDQRTIDFYGDELTAVLVEDEHGQTVYVPIRPICDFLGVAWSPQRRRINRDVVLSRVAMSVTVTVTDIDPSSRQPRHSAILLRCLGRSNGCDQLHEHSAGGI